MYEASICGAIPIVVGSQTEIKETFCKEENPPWLTFNSWDNAKVGCVKLLEDINKLNKLSQENINWWKKRIIKLQILIQSYL